MFHLRTIGIATFFFASLPIPIIAQTVTLSLSSPQNAATVAPGGTINWSIGFTVSSGNNAGLALLSVDLVQGTANPAKIDIPPANGVPTAMAGFSRPAGVSNPGETNPATGYVGVQRGAAGEKNLKQVGGAQNTLGQALPPGSGMAESANVVGGVGQGGSVTLASGSFNAPATAGTYVYQLENPVASVLTAVNPLPQHSPVTEASAILAPASFTFTVGGAACVACDVNCDGENDARDIQTFVARLLPSPPAACSACAGDLNGSGGLTVADIGPFVACLLGT